MKLLSKWRNIIQNKIIYIIFLFEKFALDSSVTLYSYLTHIQIIFTKYYTLPQWRKITHKDKVYYIYLNEAICLRKNTLSQIHMYRLNIQCILSCFFSFPVNNFSQLIPSFPHPLLVSIKLLDLVVLKLKSFSVASKLNVHPYTSVKSPSTCQLLALRWFSSL